MVGRCTKSDRKAHAAMGDRAPVMRLPTGPWSYVIRFRWVNGVTWGHVVRMDVLSKERS
ncbi:hypothetical protein [Methanoregula sp.]|uniref:hypothetical protein n=1 Tax=Methanoregula sp. TaxID=2052170 RepID=UPI003C751E5F